MPESAWSFRILWAVTIVIVVFVVWVYTVVEDCCDSDPGRGPIIIAEPTDTGGVFTTSWKLGASSSSAAAITSWGPNDQLREDLFGMVEMFVAADEATPTTEFEVTKTTLVVTNASSGQHTIVIERSSSGQVSWTIDGNPLVACDFSTAGSPPNCTSSGVPAGFNGTINSLTTEPATPTIPTYPDPTSVAIVKIQPKQ